MSMARPSYKIDRKKPGTELAAETAAALAAASVVFRGTNSNYADLLVRHAKELYEFADKYRQAAVAVQYLSAVFQTIDWEEDALRNG